MGRTSDVTARSWYDSATADFFNPFAWTPIGTPQPGDSLTISNGNPVASNVTLDGYSILLGGSNGSPGPALTSSYIDLTQNGQIGASIPNAPAPNPILTLSNATIGPGTTIRLPSALAILGGPPAGDATIFARGYAENDGTIKTGGGLFSIGGTLNISIDHGYGLFENKGTITIGSRSDAVLTGYDSNPPPGSPPQAAIGADMSNDGVINVYGSVLDTSVRLHGTGTINLDSSPGFLGLSPIPGRFEYVGYPENSSGDNHNTVVFHGGQLILAELVV
jgi:hypothetical protein